MPGNPQLQSLPDDDYLRLVVWSGRVVAQAAEFKTARFAAYLRRIDDYGNLIDNHVDEIIESVGAISLFPIGACFRHQQRVERIDHSPPKVLSIKVPDRWEVRRASDRNPSSTRSFIPLEDIPLKMTSFQGSEIRGFDAWLVVTETADGKRVLIPSVEVFRAFYAATSVQAIGIFRDPWSKSRSEFLESSEATIQDDGTCHWHLRLKKGVPISIVRALCWLEFVPGASAIANQTHLSLVNQQQMGMPPWIKAVPPISEGILKIQAQTKWLKHSKALLVTQIRDFKPEIEVSKITFTVPEKIIPSVTESDGDDQRKEGVKRKPGLVAKPRDRRNTTRHFDLSGDPMFWSGLPEPEVTPLVIRHIPTSGTTTHSKPAVEVAVSVGETSGSARALPAAQITSNIAERHRSRFEEVILTLDLLLERQWISKWSYQPIYQPFGEMYCAFPELKATAEQVKVARWSQVKGIARVALVVSIEIDSRTIYWIEIEPVPRGYKALALQMLDGDPIDELTVANLLEGCARSLGIWDVSQEYCQRPIEMTAVMHASDHEKKLSPNIFLRAFMRLKSKLNQHEESVLKDRETTAGQLTEHVSLSAVIPH